MIEQLLKGKHLLIAEDNITNQLVVAKMIEALGGTFDMASDGVEAIEMFDPKKYHLALLDIEMPRKSGLEVIRYIRQHPDVPQHFPVVALTAFVLSNHKVQIREAGATTILSKPIVDINEFGHSLSKYFEDETDELDEHKIDINVSALEDLKNSLGADIVSDLIQNLDTDLQKIHDSLSNLSKPVDVDTIRGQTHALLSLAGMAGADELVAMTQNLNLECENLSDDELLSASVDILEQIKELQKYIINWNG